MKRWYAKELSQLAHVSVRTLHHYDKIGLLKPSLRESNNYRLYSEKDLLKLQQIVALKFFGFDLSQIKELLASHEDILKNLTMQAKFLQEKAETLLEASTILQRITHDCSNKKSIPWEQILQLIEVYNMTQQLENSWVKEILNPKELEQYVHFETDLKSRFTEEEKKRFEAKWFKLVDRVNANLHNDPTSKVGIDLAEESMEVINSLYGKKHANLRATTWEKGFKEGKGLSEHGLTPEIVKWLDKAFHAYWQQRINKVLIQAEKVTPSEFQYLWNEVMDEMCGEDNQSKTDILNVVLKDDNLSQKVKNALKTFR